jgi:accessory colonization factor AcfC
MADLKESGSAGPGKRMQALVDRYYKQTIKKSGEVKQKPISQKKWERKAEKATSDLHLPSEKQDRLELLRYPGNAKYDSKGRTSQRKVVKKGKDQKIKKAFVKETFEPGKAPPPPRPKGGYIQMPSRY